MVRIHGAIGYVTCLAMSAQTKMWNILHDLKPTQGAAIFK
jgi:hypothetical protein